MLVDYDWLAARKIETPGRTATVYVANPKSLAVMKAEKYPSKGTALTAKSPLAVKAVPL